MLKIIILSAITALLIGCGEKSKTEQIWKEDFLSQRLPWHTYLGDPNWRLTEGIWVITAAAPFEELVCVDRDWTVPDYHLKVTIRLGETGEAGIVLGFLDKENFWRVSLDHSKNHIALIERVGGKDRQVAEGCISLKHAEFHNIEVKVTDAILSVHCDNLLVFETGRPQGLKGRLGLYAAIFSPPKGRIYANFSSFEVKPRS